MTRWKLVAALAAVAAVVIASVIVLLVGSGRQAATPPPAPPPVRIDPPAQGTAAPTAAPTSLGEERPMPGDQTAQVEVANAYMDAFLRPGTPAEREARLKDLATPNDLVLAKQVANERLPNAKRKTSAALDPGVARANEAYAHVQLTDDTWWGMGLVKDLTAPKGWRVSFLEKEGH
ncbi:hypothetical protein CGZ95_07470 [Enemella evansiae]|uniref:hypothetical protein n=1 Tax=Enemella evansiae TaxID=2016499 RepID=UPI000B96988B|nr:hypothetical protein [Enemella evansiae]OYO00481.1 hypothetical protein CGZ95_07470 [Enemella evansiae]OYO16942.1 hypothetical protein BI335_09290 [Enemella evansiae]